MPRRDSHPRGSHCLGRSTSSCSGGSSAWAAHAQPRGQHVRASGRREGASPDRKLCSIGARSAGYQIGCGLRWRRRHVGSERNVSDAGLRRAMRGFYAPGQRHVGPAGRLGWPAPARRAPVELASAAPMPTRPRRSGRCCRDLPPCLVVTPAQHRRRGPFRAGSHRRWTRLTPVGNACRASHLRPPTSVHRTSALERTWWGSAGMASRLARGSESLLGACRRLWTLVGSGCRCSAIGRFILGA